MKKVLKLYQKYAEIINYVIVGVLTTLVSLGTYYVCVYTFLNPNISWQLQLANIISWLVSVTFAYVTNRLYVFKSKDPDILKEGVKFYGARLLTLVLDMVFMYLTVTIFKFNDKIMKLLSNVLVLVLNYILSKIFVFIKKDGKNDKK